MNLKIKVSIISLVILTLGTFAAIDIYKTVAIVIDKQVITTTFWGFTVGDALSSAQVPVFEGDVVSPSLDEWIKENQVIEIQRAAWVIILKGNEEYTIWTPERKTATLLKSAGLELKPREIVYYRGNRIDLEHILPYSPVITLKITTGTPIQLIDGEKEVDIVSYGSTIMDALWEAGIKKFAADRLELCPQTQSMEEQIHVILDRSQEVTIYVDDSEIKTRVLGPTVGDALAEAGISIQDMDYSIPADGSFLIENQSIEVVRVTEEYLLEQEFIPFGIEYIASQEIELDTQQIIQTGEYGIKVSRIRVLYEDEEEISRTPAETWIAKEPKPRKVGYGTKVTLRTVDTPEGPIQYYRAVDAYATSYSPCRIGVPGKCSSTTASGSELKKGVIGVIRSWYNYMRGSRVYIPGYGFGTIEDIGAGFSDRYWVDLGFSDEDWISWSRYVTVYFLTPVPTNILYILN